ncbi:ipa protein [Hirsutella rhossiliensis]|uniref:Ipa protein n=1 Tax=Hirsutella rhossiliensis TaxID=111463 RepID=A0A9P8SGX7_9HYPO|nr:ipa protein [Hirsutella rhossiliensis]KAH0962266.1 ipa protein [Hirsutella rhossiliensis]
MDLMSGTFIVELLKVQHTNFANTYKAHGAAVETFWRSLDSRQRAKCLLQVEQQVEQQGSGELAGGTQTTGFGKLLPESDNRFLDGDRYGEVVIVPPGTEEAETLTALGPTVNFAPWSIGNLILLKQLSLLQTLKAIFNNLLHESSRPTYGQQLSQSPDKAASAIPSEPTIQAPPAKMSLSSLVAFARDQRDSLGENLDLFCTEPLVLAYYVNACLRCQPKAVADGQSHPESAKTDADICAAFYRAVHIANRSAAIWNYITHLLELLESCTADEAFRGTLLQEISNACHVEYSRAQALVRQYIQTTIGVHCFETASKAYDEAGNPRISMRGKPEDLAPFDSQLRCILRLCQPETNASKAAQWKDELVALHQAHRSERERLSMRESEALWGLFAIIQLIQDLSSTISMPSFSRRKRRAFVSKSRKLEVELDQIGKQIKPRETLLLLNKLRETTASVQALVKLDEIVAEKAGAKMSLLYQNLVDECLSNIRKQHLQAESEAKQENEAEWVPFPASAQQSPKRQIEPQRRRQKTKTRPAHSSALGTAPPAEPPVPQPAAAAPQTLTVSLSTAAVFLTLFKKSQARGSVSWVAFEAAMVDVGFSIEPNCGSIYVFTPPKILAVQRPFSFHRPHDSHLERPMLHVLTRRLKRVYDWNKDTFKTA